MAYMLSAVGLMRKKFRRGYSKPRCVIAPPCARTFCSYVPPWSKMNVLVLYFRAPVKIALLLIPLPRPGPPSTVVLPFPFRNGV